MLNDEYNKTFDKINDLCIENELEFTFESSRFPIVARVTPNFEQKNQMKMDIGNDTDFINGEVQFIFDDELTMKVLNDFRIEDSLLNKIKNMSKKLHYLFLQIYFKEAF